MKVAIVTVAGISSRFNEGIEEAQKQLKAIYSENDPADTLLYHLLQKCQFADKIVIVGGYQFDRLTQFCKHLDSGIANKVALVYNAHYVDLASGYSLYLGLQEAFAHAPGEILFVEGDLDIDNESFLQVVQSDKSVLTYTYEPIYANKAVVLYRDEKERYRYVFNSRHGMLSIDSPFSCVLNSGQMWKFTDMQALRKANEQFFKDAKDGTNLWIIQKYLDSGVHVDLVGLKRWTNCNTKEDYQKIKLYWEAEK